jgi:hypothetical protein
MYLDGFGRQCGIHFAGTVCGTPNRIVNGCDGFPAHKATEIYKLRDAAIYGEQLRRDGVPNERAENAESNGTPYRSA